MLAVGGPEHFREGPTTRAPAGLRRPDGACVGMLILCRSTLRCVYTRTLGGYRRLALGHPSHIHTICPQSPSPIWLSSVRVRPRVISATAKARSPQSCECRVARGTGDRLQRSRHVMGSTCPSLAIHLPCGHRCVCASDWLC